MKKNTKPYLDKPNKKKNDTNEQLLFGNGQTLQEKQEKDKKYKKINLNE